MMLRQLVWMSTSAGAESLNVNVLPRSTNTRPCYFVVVSAKEVCI